MTDDKEERRTLLVRIARTLADKLTDVAEAILAYRAVVDDFGADRAVARRAGHALRAGRPLAGSRRHARGRPRAGRVGRPTSSPSSPASGEVRQAKLSGRRRAPSRRTARRWARSVRRSVPGGARGDARGRRTARRDGRGASCGRSTRPTALTRSCSGCSRSRSSHAESISEKLATIAQAVQVAEGPLGDPARRSSTRPAGCARRWRSPSCPRGSSASERLAAATGKHAELVELLRWRGGRHPRRRRAARGHPAHRRGRAGPPGRLRAGARSTTSEGARPARRRSSGARGARVALRGDRATTPRCSTSSSGGRRSARPRRSASSCSSSRRASATRSSETRRAAIGVYEQILDMGVDADGHRGPRAPLRAGRALGGPRRALRAADRRRRACRASGRQRSTTRSAACSSSGWTSSTARSTSTPRRWPSIPKHPQTVASLEALMGHADHAARAAEMLEPVYQARLDWRRVMATLEARLDASQDPDERRQLLRPPRQDARGAGGELPRRPRDDREAPRRGPDRRSDVGRARAPRARGERRGSPRRRSSPSELEKITSDEPATARLAQAHGRAVRGAEGRRPRARLLPARARLRSRRRRTARFEAIDRLLREAGAPARARAALPRRRSTTRTTPPSGSTRSTRSRCIEEAELHDDAAAIETYRAALDVDESDAARARGAVAPLRADRAVARSGRPDAQARRAERAARRTRRASAWTSRKLLLDKLGEPQAGIDELQIVVDLVAARRGRARRGGGARRSRSCCSGPEHKARVVDILRPIYERADDWRHLVAVNEERLALATDDARPDRASYRETAQLWEERGADKQKAFDAMRAAWTLDPEDGDAREQLERLAEATKRWDDLAAAYETAIAKTEGLTQARARLGARAASRQAARRPATRARRVGSPVRAGRDRSAAARGDGLSRDAAQRLGDARARARRARRSSCRTTRRGPARGGASARRSGTCSTTCRGPSRLTSGRSSSSRRARSRSTTSSRSTSRRTTPNRLVDLYRRRVELCGEDDEALKFQLLVDAATPLRERSVRPARSDRVPRPGAGGHGRRRGRAQAPRRALHARAAVARAARQPEAAGGRRRRTPRRSGC